MGYETSVRAVRFERSDHPDFGTLEVELRWHRSTTDESYKDVRPGPDAIIEIAPLYMTQDRGLANVRPPVGIRPASDGWANDKVRVRFNDVVRGVYALTGKFGDGRTLGGAYNYVAIGADGTFVQSMEMDLNIDLPFSGAAEMISRARRPHDFSFLGSISDPVLAIVADYPNSSEVEIRMASNTFGEVVNYETSINDEVVQHGKVVTDSEITSSGRIELPTRGRLLSRAFFDEPGDQASQVIIDVRAIDRDDDVPPQAASSPAALLPKVERRPEPIEVGEQVADLEQLIGRAEHHFHDGSWKATPDVEELVRVTLAALRSELYPPVEQDPSGPIVEVLAGRLLLALLEVEDLSEVDKDAFQADTDKLLHPTGDSVEDGEAAADLVEQIADAVEFPEERPAGLDLSEPVWQEAINDLWEQRVGFLYWKLRWASSPPTLSKAANKLREAVRVEEEFGPNVTGTVGALAAWFSTRQWPFVVSGFVGGRHLGPYGSMWWRVVGRLLRSNYGGDEEVSDAESEPGADDKHGE